MLGSVEHAEACFPNPFSMAEMLMNFIIAKKSFSEDERYPFGLSELFKLTCNFIMAGCRNVALDFNTRVDRNVGESSK